MGEGARGVPALLWAAQRTGGCHATCAFMGMTRTDNNPLFRNRNSSRRAALEDRARALRASLTASEALLWQRVRGRKLGAAFRRQVPLLGRFIADFLAPAQRLVIEIDGSYHALRARADVRRDAALARAGSAFFALDAALLTRDIEAAISRVRAALRG